MRCLRQNQLRMHPRWHWHDRHGTFSPARIAGESQGRPLLQPMMRPLRAPPDGHSLRGSMTTSWPRAHARAASRRCRLGQAPVTGSVPVQTLQRPHSLGAGSSSASCKKRIKPPGPTKKARISLASRSRTWASACQRLPARGVEHPRCAGQHPGRACASHHLFHRQNLQQACKPPAPDRGWFVYDIRSPVCSSLKPEARSYVCCAVPPVTRPARAADSHRPRAARHGFRDGRPVYLER